MVKTALMILKTVVTKITCQKVKKIVGSINIEHANSVIIAWTGILLHVKKYVIMAKVGLDASYFIKLHSKSTVSKATVQEIFAGSSTTQN